MTRSILFLLTALLWANPTVQGAVALFTDGEFGTAQLVSQRALITFAHGRQRLVMESSYTGSNTNLAWIIPLPSRPVVETVPGELFPTLSHLFQPQLIARVRPWWLYLAAMGLVVALVRLLYPRSRLGAALVGLTALLSSVLLWLPNQSPPTQSPYLALGQYGNATPVLPTPKSAVLEITVLEQPAERTLRDWLASNGFQASTGALELFAEYANRGWVFVALNTQSLADTNRPVVLPSISLTFESPQPVYPLRFTALNTTPVPLDLFVFGIGRARASGFQTKRCSLVQTNLTPSKWGSIRANSPLDLRHPELRSLVAGAPFGTWLHRILEPTQSQQDVQIEWIDRERNGERLYTHTAALHLAANVAAFSLLGCTLILLGLRRRLPRGQCLNPTLSRLLFAVAGIALLTYLMIPKLEDQQPTPQGHALNGAPTPHSPPFPRPEPPDPRNPTAD